MPECGWCGVVLTQYDVENCVLVKAGEFACTECLEALQ